MADTYANFAALKAAKVLNTDYRINVRNAGNHVAHIAIHAGAIEAGTGEIADATASALSQAFYSFEGIQSTNNSQLHITSTHFDEPQCLAVQRQADRTVSYHGLSGSTPVTHLGGADVALKLRIGRELENAGFVVDYQTAEDVNGDSLANITNRNKSRYGVQLELTLAQRQAFFPGGDTSSAMRQSGQRTATFYAYRDAIVRAVTHDVPATSNDPLNQVRVELAVGDTSKDSGLWTWADITGDLTNDSVTTTRGSSDAESTQPDPSSCTFTLDNSRGDYTPNHGQALLYPAIDMGTPVRVSVPALDDGYLFLSGMDVDGDEMYAYTPGLNTTGDLDLRADVFASSVAAGGNWIPIAAKDYDSDQRSWSLILETTGTLSFRWSVDGVNWMRANSGVVDPAPLNKRLQFRVFLDVDNGAGGWTVTFYKSTTGLDGPWTTVSSVSGTGTTSVFASTSRVTLGIDYKFLSMPYMGVYGFRYSDGSGFLGGVDFTNRLSDSKQFDGFNGETWLFASPWMGCVNPKLRFTGHVPEWHPTWPYGDVDDQDGGFSQCAVTASGFLRRMYQGEPTARSPLYQAFSTAPSVVAYWPCEEGPGSTSFPPAVGDGTPATFADGGNKYNGAALYSDSTISSPIPVLGQSPSGATVPTAQYVGIHANTGIASPSPHWRVMMYVDFSDQLPGNVFIRPLPILLSMNEGTIRTLYIDRSEATGSCGLVVVGDDWRTIIDTGDTAFLFNSSISGKRGFLGVTLDQVGASTVKIGASFIDESDGSVHGSIWTVNNETVGYPTYVYSVSATPATMAVGHIAIMQGTEADQDFLTIYNYALHGWAQELPFERIARVGNENGIPVEVETYGDVNLANKMGPMTIAKPSDIFTDCIQVDGGVIAESRDGLGLRFRPLEGFFSRPTSMVLDASNGFGDIVSPFEPTRDDADFCNDATVSRPNGTTRQTTDDADIAKRGRYASDDTVNAFYAFTLQQIASWKVAAGTTPDMRYPSVSPALAARPELIRAWSYVDIGDKITVRGLPSQHPQTDVRMVVRGYTETISPQMWEVTANTTPAEPYRVAFYDSATNATPLDPTDDTRFDAVGSTVGAYLNPTATTLTVSTLPGCQWFAGDYPYDITVGGEVMRVTNVATVNSTTQTFTVTRSINGVVKGQQVGTSVNVAYPVTVGF